MQSIPNHSVTRHHCLKPSFVETVIGCRAENPYWACQIPA